VAKELLFRTGTEVLFVKTDLTKKKDIHSMVKQTVEKYGQIAY
jgi:NADP-dependent 3-hydroxy acid dehydrogenase YdfG